MKKQKVVIFDRNHPHYSERGYLKINENGNIFIKKIGDVEMFEVELIDCPHGVKSCCVTKDVVRLIREL